MSRPLASRQHYVLLLAAALVIHFASPPLSAEEPPRPSWFDQVQFLQTWNSIDDLPENVYTGRCWGPIPVAQAPSSEIRRWQQLGGPFIMAVSTTTDWTEEYQPSTPSDRMVDLDGNPSNHPWPPPNPRYTILSEGWRNFLKGKVKLAIDQGADGIQFDDAQMPPLTFRSWNESIASFDPVTMEAFRLYMAAHFSATELSDKFSIPDIATFNLRDWINSNHRRGDWNQQPFVGIAREFYTFLLRQTDAFFRDITEFARSYAQQQYQRTFTVSANTSFSVDGYFLLDNLDYYVNESYPFSDRSPFANLDIKTFRAIRDWPVVVLPEPQTPGIPGRVSNMMKLILADIYSAGGTVAFGKKLTDGLALSFPTPEVDVNVLSNYSSFVRSNPHLYQHLTPVSDVGLINSMSSKGGHDWSQDASVPYPGADDSYSGLGFLLMDSNYQFTPILAPDTRFSSLSSFSLSDLQRFKVLVAPHMPSLTDDQVSILGQYVQQGGTILATGYLGTHTEDGLPADRPVPAGTPSDGPATTLGSGRIVRTAGFEGFQYLPASMQGKAALRSQLQALLAKELQPVVTVSTTAPVYRPGGGTVFLYESQQQQWIAHIVNYDFDQFTDTFAEKTNLDVEFNVGARAFNQAVFVSPDEPDPQPLEIRRVGQTLAVTIPKLSAYGVVVLENDTTAPRIDSNGQPDKLHVVSGNKIELAANAHDQDGNPVFLRWYLDGALVPYERGTTFSFQSDRNTTNEHKITLVASDGNHETTKVWTVVTEPYTYPKVVFSETKGERNSTDLQRASILNTEHPEWVSFDKLRHELEGDFVITRAGGTGALPTILEDADVLVISAPTEPFSQEEITAIVASVAAGKGLIFVGDVGVSPNINDLLGHFGLFFDDRPIFSNSAIGQGNLTIDNFVSHAANLPGATFSTNWGGSFSAVSAPSVPLGFTTPGAWRNLDTNEVRDEGEPSGPFVVAAAAEYGKGRVWAVSDNAFHDDFLRFGLSNSRLFNAALHWVSESATTRLPPAFSASSIVNSASYVGGAVAPGEIITIFGSSLAHPNLFGAQLTTDGLFVRKELEGVQVSFDDISAPLIYTSQNQISAIVPMSLAGRETTRISVRYLDKPSDSVSLSVVETVPGIFTLNSTGSGQGAILNQDLTVNSPSNPASRGSVVIVYGTSGGLLEPSALDGEVVPIPKQLRQPVGATISGQPAQVEYAGASPGLVAGVVQFNVRIPQASPVGEVPISVTVGGSESQPGVTFSVH